MNGTVLKSNGTYKHISLIRPGEYLVNEKGRPVRVVSNKRHRIRWKTDLLSLYHKHWYEPLLCIDKYKVLTWDIKDTSGLWQHTADIKPNSGTLSMMPLIIDWDMPTTFQHKFGKYVLEPSYELGYMFGAFVRCGFINKYKGAGFMCSIKQQFLIDKLIECGNNVFGHSPMFVSLSFGNQEISQVSYHDDDICDVFEELIAPSSHINRLPLLYHCKNYDYVRGLSDGLVQSGMLNKTYISSLHSQTLYETMCWTTFTKHKGVHYGGIINRWDSNMFLSDLLDVKHLTTKQTEYFYELEVDCDSQSFVINNMVIST